MINGRAIEVRYYGNHLEVVNRIIAVGFSYPGLAIYWHPQDNEVIEFWEDKKKWREFHSNLSSTSLLWKLKELIEGSATCLKRSKTVGKGAAQSAQLVDLQRRHRSKKASTSGSATSEEKLHSVKSTPKKDR